MNGMPVLVLSVKSLEKLNPRHPVGPVVQRPPIGIDERSPKHFAQDRVDYAFADEDRLSGIGRVIGVDKFGIDFIDDENRAHLNRQKVA